MMATQMSTMNSLDAPTSLSRVPLPEVLPPIVIVAFTRPELLAQVLAAIAVQTVRPPKVLAYLDGIRSPRDEPLVQECIDVLEEFGAVIPVEIVVRPENLGCDRNVIMTLTEVLERYPAVVYLEDDVVPNAGFYDRMCRLLARYRDVPQVFSVSGYANFPDELRPGLDADFVMSNRVFALGLGLWSDRWRAIDLMNQPPGHNPFGGFDRIPATLQTQYTIVNQFFIEKNGKTDWVISMTLAALYRGYVHVIPTRSMVRNIGFGHAEAVNYRGAEPDWANANFDPEAFPDRLPVGVALPSLLAERISGRMLVRHLRQQEGMWLSPRVAWGLVRRSGSWADRWAWLGFFGDRFLVMARRWRSGRSI
jgi:hypothetical protein